MIKAGDQIPDAEVQVMGAEGPRKLSSRELFAGGKVVLFAVPGAFTPTCSQAHLPGFVVNADKIKAQGVARILCLSVNDAFVMDAWGKSQNADADDITMVADGNGAFSKALGLTLDARGFGMGTRSQRFALIAQDGVVSSLHVEDGGGLKHSSAEAILKALQS